MPLAVLIAPAERTDDEGTELHLESPARNGVTALMNRDDQQKGGRKV
jgi:hypothetical protein